VRSRHLRADDHQRTRRDGLGTAPEVFTNACDAWLDPDDVIGLKLFGRPASDFEAIEKMRPTHAPFVAQPNAAIRAMSRAAQ
jgi:hypothetical protein